MNGCDMLNTQDGMIRSMIALKEDTLMDRVVVVVMDDITTHSLTSQAINPAVRNTLPSSTAQLEAEPRRGHLMIRRDRILK